MDVPLLDHLITLECELLESDTRHNPRRLNELLADDFWECGKWWDQFWKLECLESLPKEPAEKTLIPTNVKAHLLSETIAHVTFMCEIRNPLKEPISTTSFRSSLWRKTEKWWQMFFHQGTLIQ